MRDAAAATLHRSHFVWLRSLRTTRISVARRRWVFSLRVAVCGATSRAALRSRLTRSVTCRSAPCCCCCSSGSLVSGSPRWPPDNLRSNTPTTQHLPVGECVCAGPPHPHLRLSDTPHSSTTSGSSDPTLPLRLHPAKVRRFELTLHCG